MIKYTLLKAVQTMAFVLLPILFWNQAMDGLYFWAAFDLFVLSIYISDVRDKTLEKKLHGELY